MRGRRQRRGRAGRAPVAFGELVDRESLVVDADDGAAFEVAEDPGARDLNDIGNVGGRKVRQRGEPELAVGRRREHAVEEDDVQ